MKTVFKEHVLSGLLYFSSGIFLVLLFFMALDSSIWVDEAYTMGIVKYSIPELIQVTAQDVHPPLYYIIVKLVLSVIRVEDLYTKVIVARMVSLLPYVGMWVLSLTYIRKYFGELAGSLFSLCLMAAPQMIANALEIRMYSWALCFLIVAFLAIHRLIVLQKKDILGYVVLGTAVLCAFYTHYFAAIAAAVLLLFYFIMILFYDKKQLLSFFVMCVIDAILYFPWILVAFGQIQDIRQDYWIAPIDRAALLRYFWYAFRIEENLPAKIAGGVLILASLIGVVVAIYNRQRREYLLALAAMMVMPLTVLAGVLASFLLRPVFVERYMIPAFGCFWLGFAYLISHFRKKNYLWIIICILFLGLGIRQYVVNFDLSRENRIEMQTTRELFENMGQEDMIVHASLNTEIPAAFYCPNSTQYIMAESSTLRIDQIVFDNVENVMTPEDMKNNMEKKNIWCFVYPNEDTLSEEWRLMLKGGKYVGEYVLDWCKFQVYAWN